MIAPQKTGDVDASQLISPRSSRINNSPLGACDKTLIYVDAPGWKADHRVVQIDGPDETNRFGGFETVVKQTLQVKDSFGNVLDTVKHTVKVAVDEDLNATFSP